MAKDKYYDELVIVKLYKNNILTDDVFVTVGGRTLIVPRGKEVKIPRKYAIALQNMEAHKIEIKSLTNYDRIRNMTIEEMAEFMRTMLDCVSCQNKMMNNNNPFGKEKCNDENYFKMCGGDYKKCLAVCKKWLESEVE